MYLKASYAPRIPFKAASQILAAFAALATWAGCSPTTEATLADLQYKMSVPDEQTRYMAAKALGDMGPKAAPAVRSLVAGLNDPSTTVRSVAAYALADIGPGAADAVPELIQALRDTSKPEARRAAIYALPAMGPRAEEALPRLRNMLSDADSAVRSEARQAIAKIELAAKYRAMAVH